MPLIDLYARFLFLCVAALHCPVIPSVAEESRGNERGGLNLYLLSPRGGERWIARRMSAIRIEDCFLIFNFILIKMLMRIIKQQSSPVTA